MSPHLHCVVSKGVDVIDQLGILQATLIAMEEAASEVISLLQSSGISGPAYALIDGPCNPKNMPCPSKPLVRGDNLSLSIAGASIIAKNKRDSIMNVLDADWPEYGWCRNCGYGTPEHQRALETHGLSPHHRRSFAPIRRLCGKATNKKENF